MAETAVMVDSAISNLAKLLYELPTDNYGMECTL
jgi:hypothetical protein